MARGIGRLQVHEVGDRLQGGVQILLGHHRPKARLGVDDVVPVGGVACALQHVRREIAEKVDKPWMLSPARVPKLQP